MYNKCMDKIIFVINDNLVKSKKIQNIDEINE